MKVKFLYAEIVGQNMALLLAGAGLKVVQKHPRHISWKSIRYEGGGESKRGDR